MARGRMLSQTIATDAKLNSVSRDAEYLYLKTIPHLDRDGLIFGESFMLLAKVCPRRQDMIPIIEGLIIELIEAGLVLRYETDEGDALFFYGFTKNQSGMRYDREAASAFAPPPGYIRDKNGLTIAPDPPTPDEDVGDSPDDDGEDDSGDSSDCRPNPGEVPTSSGSTPPQDQGEDQAEVKDQVKDQSSSTSAMEIEETFDDPLGPQPAPSANDDDDSLLTPLQKKFKSYFFAEWKKIGEKGQTAIRQWAYDFDLALVEEKIDLAFSKDQESPLTTPFEYIKKALANASQERAAKANRSSKANHRQPANGSLAAHENKFKSVSEEYAGIILG